MQDRSRQFDEIFLQRTAGPYIRVKSAGLTVGRSLPFHLNQRTSRDRPDWSGSGHERTCSYSITSSAWTSSVGETETAGARRSPMTEMLRRVFAGAKSP